MTQYVLLKRDLFDCPKHMGYTGIRDKAGVYSEEHIKGYEVPIRQEYDWQEDDLYALPLDAAPEFTRACFADLARDYLVEKIRVLRDEFRGAVFALSMKDRQMDELRKENADLREEVSQRVHRWAPV